MNLRSTQVVLLVLGGLALSLAGVPHLFVQEPAPQALRGVVVDGRGFGVEGARVALFSEEAKALVGETRTDAQGDYSFPVSTRRPRVCILPPPESGLVAAWGPPSEEFRGRADFVLPAARTLDVRVLDFAGEPVEHAEVRAYELRREPAVVALDETDELGLARLSAPPRAHVAVLGPAPTRIALWRFELEIAGKSAELEFTLPPARVVRGVVRSAGVACGGVLVTACRTEHSQGWSSFAFSADDGTFELACPLEPLVLLAVTPDGSHLPARRLFDEPPLDVVAWELEAARPVLVRTTRGGLPLATRLWSWSPEALAWSYGTLSGARGEATLPVGERYSVHAEPLDPAFGPLAAWDVPNDGDPLRLEAQPRP